MDPLVKLYKTMENQNYFIGTLTISTGPFSMAMSHYQSVLGGAEHSVCDGSVERKSDDCLLAIDDLVETTNSRLQSSVARILFRYQNVWKKKESGSILI